MCSFVDELSLRNQSSPSKDGSLVVSIRQKSFRVEMKLQIIHCLSMAPAHPSPPVGASQLFAIWYFVLVVMGKERMSHLSWLTLCPRV